MMSSDLNSFPFPDTQGTCQHERKARTAGEHRRRNPVEIRPPLCQVWDSPL